MKFLCLSDLHGHADALQAVLDLGQRRGCSRVLVAGDLCFPGPSPLATWKLLMAANASCVQGIGDKALATVNLTVLLPANEHETNRVSRLRDVRKDLGELILARLAKLPPTLRIPLPDGGELLVVHGSPADPTEGMSADMTDEELMALVGDDPADVIVCGSTHVPFERVVSEIRIVNVGSVGEAPGGGMYAHATIIEATTSGIFIEQVVVPRGAAA